MPAQHYGYEAKAFLSEQVRGKRAQVYVSDRDQYGREIGDIRLDGQDIDLLMVQQGLAWAYREYLPADQADTYLAAEEAAKSSRLGLWAEAKPTPTWEWRHSHG
jgi:endonuclease YncB( thermonuclease family)